VVWGRLGWVVWGSFWVLCNTFVCNLSDISSRSIYGVSNNLGTTIRKVNTVFTSGSITITVFVGSKRRFGVIILDSITELVNSWCIICWFLAISWGVIRGWLVISWCWVGNWCVYDNWGYIWSWFVDNWGMIWSWLVEDWGMIRCWLVCNWCMIRSWGMIRCWGMIRSWGCVVDWGSFVSWSWVIDWGSVIWGGMVDGWGSVIWGSMVDGWVSISWGVYWNMGRGMYSGTILFRSIRVVYRLGSGMGLARNNGVVNTMRLMDRVAYGRGIAMLDCLVA